MAVRVLKSTRAQAEGLAESPRPVAQATGEALLHAVDDLEIATFAADEGEREEEGSG